MLDIDINKTKTIKEFATSSFFVQLAKNYIGKKISISGQCYISNPIPVTEGQKKDFAQYFHYDNDFKKFLKFLFI